MTSLIGNIKLEFSQSARQLIMVWLVLRVLTMVWVSVVSPLHPYTPIEQEVALWPPSAPVSRWAERAVLAPWDRRDSTIYGRIVTDGYQADPASIAFHPLYPLLGSLVNRVIKQPLAALFLVSSVAGLVYLIWFEKLARRDFDQASARAATMVMLLFPPMYAIFAAYSEALFLLLAVLCFYWLRQKKWWLAGLAGGLAALTRQQGIFLALPLAATVWAESGGFRGIKGHWRNWLAVGVVPLGYGVWVLYRTWALNDVTPDFSSVHGLVYSILISPGATKVVETQTFLWPWHAFWLAIETFLSTGQPRILIDLIIGSVFLALTVLAWSGLHYTYKIYVAAILLVSFSYHTGGASPYISLPRHLMLAFPVFVGLGPLLRHKWVQLAVLSVELVGFLFLLMLFVTRGYVP